MRTPSKRTINPQCDDDVERSLPPGRTGYFIRKMARVTRYRPPSRSDAVPIYDAARKIRCVDSLETAYPGEQCRSLFLRLSVRTAVLVRNASSAPGLLGMDSLTQKEQFERSKINVHAPDELKCWAHELGISKDELRKIVEKVGNSAAAVRKELEAKP